MNIIFRTFFIVGISSFGFVVEAYDSDMVTLGADCSENIQSGAALSVDPFDSDFVKMVESGECSGIVYSNDLIPRGAAESIMSVDPTSSYFIKEDRFLLDLIVVEGMSGENEFSIPWYWSNSDNKDLENLPSDSTPFCSPEDQNNYQSFTEIT